MALGLVGRKVGMTRIFDDNGASVAVTVLEVIDNRVTQLKTKETDGYNAVQVTFGQKKANRLNKPEAGHFAKAGVEAGVGLMEFAVSDEEIANFNVGGNIAVSMFEAGQVVDITGTTKGKGFAGNIKRNNFGSQRASHGNSVSHNAPGSIGQCQDPGRVFKGKRMAGHLGSVKCTTQNLTVVRVDAERKLLLIKGAVPGAVNSNVIVRHSVKAGA
ncbi:MAG: 50S ribosomal protein L3 [Neisseriaceae bacterium]|nr:50S ribosomal protein L3 [Neisseriaceae bacterium]